MINFSTPAGSPILVMDFKISLSILHLPNTSICIFVSLLLIFINKRITPTILEIVVAIPAPKIPSPLKLNIPNINI